MDIRYAKIIIDSTIYVLSTMASIFPKAGKPYVKATNVASGDVSGIMGLITKENKRGIFCITFTKKCAIQIVKNLLHDHIEDILEDIKDGIGEITNMICGQARRRLEKEGIVIKGAIPSVILGDNHTISHINSKEIMVIPFDTDFGKFEVEISMED